MPYKKKTSQCAACNRRILVGQIKSRNYCNTGCFNKATKTKGIDGYRKCINCSKQFPFRSSLIARNYYSAVHGFMIASKNQKVCSFKCLISYRNKHNNPAKTSTGRKKISDAAIKRGTLNLQTEEVRRKQRASITGKNHWNWQGGKTHENKLRRSHVEAKKWRKQVFERDDYTCQLCHVRGGHLEADHIKPWSLYKDLRYVLSNGRTLCKNCHRTTDTYMGRIKNYKPDNHIT